MSPNPLKSKIIIILLPIVFILANCSKNNSINEPNEFVDPADTIPNSAVIYLDNTQQIIRGFGGVSMPVWIPDMTPDQVNKAFGKEAGQLGLSILRIRVPYDSSQFYLEVPTAKLAKSMGAIVIASPWTPPAWMKNNNNIVGGKLNYNSYAAYAAHLKSFVDFMAANDVTIYAISIQNEPDISVTYESCDWLPQEMCNFLKNNAKTIGTKIIAPESYNFNPFIANTILNDAAAAANVSIIGGHIYGGGNEPYPLAAQRGKELWMTEHLDTDTTWAKVFRTAIEIDDCLNAGMNAYLWWYIRRFYGPINDDGNMTKRGYIMSQYSRFIRPGSYKVLVSKNGVPQDRVYVSAFKDGAKVIITAINNNSEPIDQIFVVRNGAVTSVTSYVTSKTKDCNENSNIPVSEGRFSATLEGKSVTTFVSE